MSGQDLEAFIRAMKRDIIDAHDPQAAARYYADDYETLNPIPGRGKGLPGLRDALAEFLAAFPDARESVEEVVVQGSRVAAVGTIRASHRGAFAGVPATGRSVTVRIFEVHHVENGKARRGWILLDMMGLMAQLTTPG
jgi:steroid delta-isomerase-like uncharacterized protein